MRPTDFAKLRDESQKAIELALAESKSRIEEIPDIGAEITGISFDVYPWHEYVALSLRDRASKISSDVSIQTNSPDWKYYEIASSKDSGFTSFNAVVELIGSLYNNSEDPRATAHLIFLAAAEALFDRKTTDALQRLGIVAPLVKSEPGGDPFSYMVFDSDGGIDANYCEIVRANRVTHQNLR